MNKKIDIFPFVVLPLPGKHRKRKHPKWDLGKDFSYKAFIKSEQFRRLLNDQNDWYNVLGSGEPYQFEPPVLEEESYASNDSFNGLKRERMIHFLYKWLLWKPRYIIEMNTFRNSLRKLRDLLPLPHAVSLFGFCCVCAYVELRFECECKCRMVLLFRVIILKSFSVTHLDFCGDHML